ncbi:extracellular triacylglycerol lipase precursor [Roridomyces roridus]|uniref:Carboxylic ester hydrolase n=1 Tax=Roridomyces roridus TaxID=1738132 RepID=A0AAD7FBJ2_9AGAR|nr:extracellular triacylglycerol lipase precursor [Roridomyces roridus]
MVFLLPLLLASVAVAAASPSPTVQLGKTSVHGVKVPSFELDSFAGIPFAEPPVGPLRLKRSVLKTSPGGATFNASASGLPCLQPIGLPLEEMSEDCLTIDVLRPSGTTPGANLPVMFWTYGGGFNLGFTSMFNATELVTLSVKRGTPVIYVVFNYRLGSLGFPQGQEADSKGALNLAIRDQLTALEWVQLNIGAFGGDKSKVTVFGESAGSIMTSILFLNSPITKLARAAIFESGSQASLPLVPAEAREDHWQDFVAGVPSCASLATSSSTFECLQNATTEEIWTGLSAANAASTAEFTWAPVIDGPGGLIPDLPSVLFERGQFARLPFIAGTNWDEGTLFTYNRVVNTTEQLVAKYIDLNSPSVSPQRLNASMEVVLKLYPDDPALGSPYNTGNETFGLGPEYKRDSAIIGDMFMLSQRRFWMAAAAKEGVQTYAYMFNESQPNVDPLLGIAHASEIYSVYGTPFNTSPEGLALSRAMTDYWVSFATSLTPNDGLGVQRPEWTQWTPQNQELIMLEGGNVRMVADDFHLEQTEYFNSDPVIWRH